MKEKEIDGEHPALVLFAELFAKAAAEDWFAQECRKTMEIGQMRLERKLEREQSIRNRNGGK